MAQDAFFTTEHSNDPKQSRDAAWDFLERLRDPRCGSGVDEEQFCGGRVEPGLPGGFHFPEARSPHPFDFLRAV